MATHELKTLPAYFAHLLDGSKTFEWRRNDRGFERGDVLVLREWDEEAGRYTGRSLTFTVGFVLRFGQPGLRGYVVMSLLSPDRSG